LGSSGHCCGWFILVRYQGDFMNPKYTKHEPKHLPVYPVNGIVYKPKKIKSAKISVFLPMLSRKEKLAVEHMTQHQRVLYLSEARADWKK
jgi:hypothetical protein